eukprot:3858693-Amphidinium_carterae.1
MLANLRRFTVVVDEHYSQMSLKQQEERMTAPSPTTWPNKARNKAIVFPCPSKSTRQVIAFNSHVVGWLYVVICGPLPSATYCWSCLVPELLWMLALINVSYLILQAVPQTQRAP